MIETEAGESIGLQTYILRAASQFVGLFRYSF